MSQKNETTVLLLSLLITVALLAAGLWWYKSNDNLGNSGGANNPGATTPGETPISNQPVENRISAGAKLLMPSDTTPQKGAATEAIAKGNYTEAIKQLEQARKVNRNDP
jgi:branched-chain amino acid transport system substrate-binding protein